MTAPDPEPPSPSPWTQPDGRPSADPSAGDATLRYPTEPGQAPEPGHGTPTPGHAPAAPGYGHPVPPPPGGPFSRPPAGDGATEFLPPGYDRTRPLPGYPQPAHPQAGYPQPGYPQAGYPPPGHQPPGYTQPGYTQPGYSQPGYSNAEYLQAGPPPARQGRGLLVGLVVGGLAILLVLAGVGVYLARTGFSSGSDTDGAEGRPGPAATGRPLPPSAPDRLPPTPTPTAATDPWAVTANTYCRVVDLELKAVPRAGGATGGAAWLRATATVIRAMNVRLRAMSVPSEHRSAYDAMMTAWEQVPVQYDLAAAAMAKGDEDGADEALARAETENQKGNAIANGLGLTDCAGAGGLGGTGGGGGAPQPSGPVV